MAVLFGGNIPTATYSSTVAYSQMFRPKIGVYSWLFLAFFDECFLSKTKCIIERKFLSN